MPRAEFGTPKYLANKMKAKGLQKLRWYCQMCQKQCRDDNGFKCHIMSESHQRQMLLFADSPGKYLHSFSQQFTEGYMELLRRRFGTKRVNANKVYQEYIAYKEHIHMNSTRWVTLSDYVKWLGRTGQVIADETEKGWYITYIDRSPEALEMQAKSERKVKLDKDDEERMMEFIEKQIEKEKAKEQSKHSDSSENATDNKEITAELKRDDNHSPLRLELRLEKKIQPDNDKNGTREVRSPSRKRTIESMENDIFKKPKIMHLSSATKKSKTKSTNNSNGNSSALAEIIQIEEAKKERANRKDYWLHEGIVVKFMSNSLGEKFYKQKAVVEEVIETYKAKIKFINGGERVKVDQVFIGNITIIILMIYCFLN